MIRENIAWAAGFYEGEGSITMHRRGDGYRCITLQIWQATVEPLENFRRVFGFGKITGPYVNNGSSFKQIKKPLQPKFSWNVSGFERVQAAIAMMWPWLSQRRRARAIELFEEYREYRAALPYQRKSAAMRNRHRNKT